MLNSFVIKNRLNQQHYIIRLAYQGSPSRALKPEIINNSFMASSFVNNLEVPFGFWESLGTRNSFFNYFNWRNANPWKKIEEYATAALVQGSVHAYKTTSLNELQQTAQQLTIKNNVEGTLKIQPATMLLLNSSVDIKAVRTLSDAQQIVSQLTIDDEALTLLLNTNNIPVAKAGSEAPSDALASALLSGEFVVTVVPEARKSSMAMDYEMVGISDPGNPPPRIQKEKEIKVSTTKPPAQSINEAETRLIAAKKEIVAAQQQGKSLPKSSYTLADKQAVIDNGLEENILVRVIETPHAGDDGTIGQVKGGRSITWTAPMSQVEHADSDAALLLNAFGTRHDASKSYTLLLIDRNKIAATGDVTSIIPTFDNLNTMIANNPDIGISPALSKQVMNADFAPKYEAFANQGWDAGVDMNDPDKRVDFAINLGHAPETADLLSERHDVAIKISAWEIFTGNGMTRDTNVKGKVAYGPVEVFSYDKNPQQLGKLEKSGALKRIALD